MPASPDYAQIYPDSSGKKIKTLVGKDSTLPDANTIETQALVPVDNTGTWVPLLTEETGQKILKVLLNIDRNMAAATNTLPIDLNFTIE